MRLVGRRGWIVANFDVLERTCGKTVSCFLGTSFPPSVNKIVQYILCAYSRLVHFQDSPASPSNINTI